MRKMALTAFLCVACFSMAGAAAHLLRDHLPEGLSAEPPAADPPSSPTLPWSADVRAASHRNESQDLAIPVRPRPMSTEEVVRLGRTLQDREQRVKAQEEAMEKQQLRLRLIAEDISAERRELENLQATMREGIAAAEELLAAIEERRQAIRQERHQAEEDLEAIQAAQTEYQEHERDNLRRMAAWFQNMEPSVAANYLKELSNEGKMDFAVQLLGNFEERDAAAIIEHMNDPQLVGQLTERFRGLQRPRTRKPTR